MNLFQPIINLTVKNIKFVRSNELNENIQKTADICNNIVKYFQKNDKISDKQLVVLERFNDLFENFEFNTQIKDGYEKYLKEIEDDLDGVIF
jgi:hypothetical protein